MKPVNVSHHSHSNSDIYSDRKYGGTTNASTKHHVYNYYVTTFDQTTVSSLQRVNFVQMVSSLFWDPFQNLKLSFEKMKKNQMDGTPSSLRWEL